MGVPAAERAEAMESLDAPDFELPDIEGETFQFSSIGKRKKLVVTWASWCGCRYDLPAWQQLAEELRPEGLDIVSVAMDDSAAAAKEWVDAAEPRPTFPVLYDREHLLGELYGITNVPSVVWIDEDDRIVRAPVIAPGDDEFKAFTNIDSSVHHDQLRQWVRHGDVPEDETEVRGPSAGADRGGAAGAARAPGGCRARAGRTARGSRAPLRPRLRARADGFHHSARNAALAGRRPVRRTVLRLLRRVAGRGPTRYRLRGRCLDEQSLTISQRGATFRADTSMSCGTRSHGGGSNGCSGARHLLAGRIRLHLALPARGGGDRLDRVAVLLQLRPGAGVRRDGGRGPQQRDRQARVARVVVVPVGRSGHRGHRSAHPRFPAHRRRQLAALGHGLLQVPARHQHRHRHPARAHDVRERVGDHLARTRRSSSPTPATCRRVAKRTRAPPPRAARRSWRHG